eukprot:6779567-Karenia_brevis.AAC.1
MLELESTTRPAQPNSRDYARQPDTTIIKLAAKKPLKRDKVKKHFEDFFPAFKGSWELAGDKDESRVFVLQFPDVTTSTAQRKVDKFLQVQKKNKHEWYEHNIVDESGESIRVNVGPDKSRMQTR